MDVQTYSPREIILSIAGHKIVGWNSIRIEKSSPTFIKVKGIRGVNTRVRDVDSSAKVVISLDQSSISNSILDQIAERDALLGTGRVSVSLSNILGGEVFFSDEAYLEGFAPMVYEGEGSDREWVIECLSSLGARNNGQLGGMVGSLLGGLF